MSKNEMTINLPTPDDPDINAISAISQVLLHLLPEDRASRKRVLIYLLKREGDDG